jgi:hypothetical protein
LIWRAVARQIDILSFPFHLKIRSTIMRPEISSPRKYLTAIETFKKVMFDCKVNSSAPRLPLAVLLGEISAPLHTVERPSDEGYARCTVEMMVDLFCRRCDFAVCEDIDVIRVLQVIDNYLVEQEDAAKIDTQVARYFRDVLAFRQNVFSSYRMIIRKHPNWAEQFHPSSALESILERQSTGKITSPIERLLAAKQKAPVAPITPQADERNLTDRLLTVKQKELYYPDTQQSDDDFWRVKL